MGSRIGRALLVGVITMVVLQGCLRIQRVSINETIQEDDVAFIVPGQTVLPEIIDRFGAPDRMKPTETGSLILYQFLDLKYARINFTWPLQFIVPALSAVPNDLYEMTLSNGAIGMDELQIGFDKAWTVVHYAFARHSQASRYIP
jgi:hypothetical protein